MNLIDKIKIADPLCIVSDGKVTTDNIDGAAEIIIAHRYETGEIIEFNIDRSANEILLS